MHRKSYAEQEEEESSEVTVYYASALSYATGIISGRTVPMLIHSGPQVSVMSNKLRMRLDLPL